MTLSPSFLDLRESKQIPKLAQLLKKNSNLLFLWPIEFELPAKPENFLSASEQQRLKGFSLPQRQQQFLASRYYSKTLLSEHLQIPPSQLDFEIQDEGKLVLPKSSQESGIDFNFSHTETLFLLGISTSHWIGVDIEPQIKKVNQTKVAEKIFSDLERKWIEEASDIHKTERFFRLWSLKEAILKTAAGGVFRHVQEIKLRPHEDLLQLQALPEDFGLLSDWELFENQNIVGFSCAWALKQRYV
jgi:4'-phosphopantetheinyl transferase